jgi:hypothetical protein
MRLQAECAPDPLHRRRGMGNLFGHGSRAPVRAPFRSRLYSLADRCSDLVVTDLARRTRARLVVEAVHPALGKSVAPRPGCGGADADLGRDLLVVEAARRRQDDPSALGDRLRCTVLARQCRQLALLHLIEYDRNSPPLRHSRPLPSSLARM